MYNRQHGWKHANKSKRKGNRMRGGGRQQRAFRRGKIKESYLNIESTTYLFGCEKERAFGKCVKGLVKACDKNMEKTVACLDFSYVLSSSKGFGLSFCLWHGLFGVITRNNQTFKYCSENVKIDTR